MEVKDYFGMNPELYSDEDLRTFRDNLLEIYDLYQNEWADELAEIVNKPNFDRFSYWGKRKLKKFTYKYADKMTDVEVLLEVVQEELDKRDEKSGVKKLREETEISENEFIQREMDKTQRIRDILSADEKLD